MRAGPPPLVPAGAALRRALSGCGPTGPLRALEPDAALELIAALAAPSAEAVAVVLLHSYAHPEHELPLGEAVAERLPGVHVSLSHEVVGTFREYERAATTEVDAALSPLLRRLSRALVERAPSAGMPEPR